MPAEFAELQRRLVDAWRADLPGSTIPHLVVGLPSLSIDPVLLSHYADRLAALEQRYLYAILLLGNPGARLAYVSSVAVPDYLVDYYVALVPTAESGSVRDRLTLVSLDDPTPRPLSQKLLERPDLLDRLCDLAQGQPAMIDPWTVTEFEQRLGLRLRMPVYGPDPALQRLGTKSGSRRLFAEESVAMPAGTEDVFTIDDVVDAVALLRRKRPGLSACVIKLNNSGAGDGNSRLDLTGLPEPQSPLARRAVRRRLDALPGWYVEKLGADGGIVEEWVDGDEVSSPSAQLSVTPEGDVVVVSTHEQILGGHSGQVYEGCRLPADPAYSRLIADAGLRIGRRLAREGVVGRFAVDFMTLKQPDDRWEARALEINLRKGGTTHPVGTIRLLTGGSYDAPAGVYRAGDGAERCYVSTDNLVDPAWLGLDPRKVIEWVADAGLAWNPKERRGVVLHMLECLAVDGRFGLTAIERTPDEAADLYATVPVVLRERTT